MNVRCGRVILLAAFVFWASSNSAHAQKWLAKHRLTWDELKAWIKGEAKGYRVVYFNGYDVGGSPRYAVVAVKNAKNLEWYWHVGSLDGLQEKDAEIRAKGCRPICVTGYLDGRAPMFGAIWVNDGQPVREKIAWNLTEKEYSERIKLETQNHFMPSMVTAYAEGNGSYRFTALFVPFGTIDWKARHDLTEEEYQKAIDQFSSEKYRPRSVTVYPTPAGLRFAVVFIKDGLDWFARHGLSTEDCVAESLKASEAGFVPVSIVGYSEGKASGLELFDKVMRKFKAERGIKAATLAVSRDGKLLLERGYGIDADAPMRLASLTKSITAAAVYRLVGEGKLSLDAKAFPLLGLKPRRTQSRDSRLDAITIRHLLEHKGGWDRDKTFDPMFRPLEIAADLKGPGPAGPADIIRYMLGQPLQFDPGTKESYSNFGYCVLGRVIEKVSGQTYLAYVKKNICEPLGIESVELGRSLPKYRNPREPIYYSPQKGRNILDPESKEEVPAPDGTFYLEAMDAHGGLIASSRDVVRFLDAYWLSGEPRQGNGRTYVSFGGLPGTFTMAMQRPNGVNVAVLFNQNAGQPERVRDQFRDQMQEAADRQTSGGLRYAAIWVKSEK